MSKKFTFSFIYFFTPAFLFLNSFIAFAQSPQGINYQAVSRDASGNPLTSQTLTSVEFKIWRTSVGGTLVHDETYSNINTNQFGLFKLFFWAAAFCGPWRFASFNWGNRPI